MTKINEIKANTVRSLISRVNDLWNAYQKVDEVLLVGWTQGKDYEPRTVTRDSEGRVTSMTVKWPDDSLGVYTATDYNSTHEVYDGYTITHADDSKVVTQSAVTRNSEGMVIIKPAITIV